MNNEEVNVFEIPTTPINIQIENLILAPGINVVTLNTDKFGLIEIDEVQSKFRVSFTVQSISIVN